MGGYGSGRTERPDAKRTTEGSMPLDIRALYRQGLLKPGWTFTSRWWRGNNPEAGNSIQGQVIGEASVELFYRMRQAGGPWEAVQQAVAVRWTACHYGGRRPWWSCPGCDRRVAVLYHGAAGFRCRHCYRLTYTVRNESDSDRLLRKAQKLRMRLGGSGNMTVPVPGRPKGMRHETYWRLLKRAVEADNASWEATAGWLDRLPHFRKKE